MADSRGAGRSVPMSLIFFAILSMVSPRLDAVAGPTSPSLTALGPNMVLVKWTTPYCRVTVYRSTNGIEYTGILSVNYASGGRNYIPDSNAPSGYVLSYALATNTASGTTSDLSSPSFITNYPAVTITIVTCQTIAYDHALRAQYTVGRTCGEHPTVEFSWRPSGTGAYAILGSELISRPVPGYPGRHVADWSLPADFDTRQRLDLRAIPSLGAWTGTAATYTNIALDLLFTSVSDLEKPCILNNPCRDGKDIVFANLVAGTRVTIYTLSGKKVAGLAPEKIAGGRLPWNLVNDAWERIHPGIYPCLLESPDKDIRYLTLIVSR